jgi:hypothetical protein
MSYEEIMSMNQSGRFIQLTEERKREVVAGVRSMFRDINIARKVCVVTDRWYFASECKRMLVHDLPLEFMRSVLSVPSDSTLPPACIECYNCELFDAALSGMLLSPRAFEKKDDECFVWISKNVLEDLQKMEKKNVQKPPRFAIADGFSIGHLSVFDDATSIEIQMISLGQIRGLVDVVYGGPGNKLSSHLLCWDNRQGHFMTKIPNVITKDNFEVILASSLTNAQLLTMRKRHMCRLDMVWKLEDALRKNNALYADVAENPTVYEHLVGDLTTTVEENVDAVQQARSRIANLTEHEANTELDEVDESDLCATETVLLQTLVMNDLERCETGVRNSLNQNSDTFVACRSSKLLDRRDSR